MIYVSFALAQLTPAFRKTLQQLMICHPLTAILPPISGDDQLAMAIEEEFSIEPLTAARNLWNRDEGELV